MQVYDAPLRDMRFVLEELHSGGEPWGDGFGNLPAHAQFTPDVTSAVLEEANRLVREVLLPINRTGDEEGCHWENGPDNKGYVRTPAGFIEAYKTYLEGGWNTLSSPEEWGGQGMPASLAKLVEEMVCATNVSFSLYPGLTHGATIAMEGHASPALKAAYLPKMVSGEWTGTMCLTEAHCGTDLGLLRTRAVPQADGSYRLTGGKIFITAGEHDLAGNIIHLVLARLPDAPAGVKGISMFLVPKFIPDAAGNPGIRNGVFCGAIEHKMGLCASPTCQMNFDEATGWLVGEENRGLACMFTMMNAERVSVGMQGLGVGEAAYQAAVWYARERIQGRALSGVKRPDLSADPIIVHPDIRRMLMTMRAYNEGCRALAGWVARALDAEAFAPDAETRARASDFVALMTPVVKALFTDLGHENANLAVQCYGGHGYIRDSGVEQYARDARIAMIYEGTNGIQALDLVGRKLPMDNGRLLRGFLHPIATFIEANGGDGPLKPMVDALAKAFGALQLATASIAERGLKDPEEGAAAATDYLRLLGLVALAFCFAQSSRIAAGKLAADTDEAGFYSTKLKTATFFFERILPQVGSLLQAIKAGKASMMALPEDEF